MESHTANYFITSLLGIAVVAPCLLVVMSITSGSDPVLLQRKTSSTLSDKVHDRVGEIRETAGRVFAGMKDFG